MIIWFHVVIKYILIRTVIFNTFVVIINLPNFAVDLFWKCVVANVTLRNIIGCYYDERNNERKKSKNRPIVSKVFLNHICINAFRIFVYEMIRYTIHHTDQATFDCMERILIQLDNWRKVYDIYFNFRKAFNWEDE